MLLNIFNGDCVFDQWRQSGQPGRTLVWRENYLTGPLVPYDDPEEFRKIRAAALHKTAPEIPEDKIRAELEAMDSAILNMADDDEMIFWFDGCLFDQIMLSRIIFLRPTCREATLICHDKADWRDFAAIRKTGRVLTGRELELYARSWPAFADPPQIGGLLAKETFGGLPALRRALAGRAGNLIRVHK